jgi:hypothetical protein
MFCVLYQAVDVARVGQSVAMKIEATNPTEQSRMYARHFDHTDQLVSRISRESIDALKLHFQVRARWMGGHWAAGVKSEVAWGAVKSCISAHV